MSTGRAAGPDADTPARAPAASGSPDPAPDVVPVHLAGRPDRDGEFAAFVRAASPELGRVAWFLTGDETRAEDLLQTSLMRTYLAWHKASAVEAGPTAYARRVMANARIDGWRRDRREALTAPSEVPDAARPSTADAHAERDLLVRALRTLTPRQRRIVVLRHLVGLSEAEVAADLGVSVGTVKSTASRALAQLRAVLHDADADPSPDRADLTPRRQP